MKKTIIAFVVIFALILVAPLTSYAQNEKAYSEVDKNMQIIKRPWMDIALGASSLAVNTGLKLNLGIKQKYMASMSVDANFVKDFLLPDVYISYSGTFSRIIKPNDNIFTIGSGISVTPDFDDEYHRTGVKATPLIGIPIDLRAYAFGKKAGLGVSVTYHFIVNKPEKQYVGLTFLFPMWQPLRNKYVQKGSH